MQTVTKTYANGNKLTIYDDGTSPAATLRVTLTKVFTAVDGEKYEQMIQEGTDNDLASEETALTTQIATLQARLTKIKNQRAALQTELNKLPVR